MHSQRVTLERGPFGTYRIVAPDGSDILVQTDYDYPALASAFGWYIGYVSAPDDAIAVAVGDFRSCPSEHDGTDGTIPCPTCGTPAATFIAAAAAWLDDHIGDTAEDPGYFSAD